MRTQNELGEGASSPKPMLAENGPSTGNIIAVWAVVIIPFVALLVAIPASFLWGFGPSWIDAVMAVTLYAVTSAGIGTGFHRYFTHAAFKAVPRLRVALGIAGSLAVQGNIVQWVADHRRHHRYADEEDDPHSPWRFGESRRALIKGFVHAHVGWLFFRELSNCERFAPDLLKDKTIMKVDRAFPLIVFVSLALPAIVGGLATWSWHGAVTGFFWAGLVRVGLLHHVTWSINSICHIWGEHAFAGKGRATNVGWLAILSFGESWHNLHHADPTCARHGVDEGQWDLNARIIGVFERFGWATNVRWPVRAKIDRLRTSRDDGAAV